MIVQPGTLDIACHGLEAGRVLAQLLDDIAAVVQEVLFLTIALDAVAQVRSRVILVLLLHSTSRQHTPQLVLVVKEILSLANRRLYLANDISRAIVNKARDDRAPTRQLQQPLTRLVIVILCRPLTICVLRPVAIEVPLEGL